MDILTEEKGFVMAYHCNDTGKVLKCRAIGYCPEDLPVNEIGGHPGVKELIDAFKEFAEKWIK